ncbi:MAG: bifunctional glutamate N-acetyltransferase/amino-acid acetyltransferase ArgJ [Holophagales bacterium]|nr:bifunctional glutamate N-acetyltransferase/amino-acid acetyltransferase ArgJ [Holophagales bacterium]
MKLPDGFLGAAVQAGLRKKPGLDVALLVAPDGANAAAVFTKNLFQAAPVTLSRAALKKSHGRVKAVVVNAGCANAVTGAAGTEAAKRVQERAAQLAGCAREEVFVASTGVIGVVLPDEKVRAFLPDAFTRLSAGGLEAVSRAILTTDAAPKVAQASFAWQGRRARVVGVAKGAGMIHPNMATMLAFVTTDAPATPALLAAALKEAVDGTFNAISVDGDTSTNDTVLLLSSGKAGGLEMKAMGDAAAFRAALVKVCGDLAWRIVRDGEGAKRVMEITIEGAATVREARLAAHAVATSPLVKTALYGGDPNWGRILAAIGRSGPGSRRGTCL